MMDTSVPGFHEFTVTARDAAGNVTVATHNYRVLDAVNTSGSAGGSVSATLSLSLGAQPTFGSLIPGLARDYTASTTANVISTAGDAMLSVADPSSSHTGHLVNGAFALPSVLQANGNGGAYAPVGGSANPTTLVTWASPVSNAMPTIGFKQSVGATDALRTGTYSKTLTFTLSTTTP
jgi:hypothetical protein